MNFLRQTFLRIGIYVLLAGFLAVFAWYKFFKSDSENVILIEGKNGNYYVKFREFSSKNNIQIIINKLVDVPSNRQVLVSEGKYKFNNDCNDNANSIEELMNGIHFYQEDQNRLLYKDRCYLENILQ